MNTQTALTIGAVVVPLTEVVKFFAPVPQRWGILVAAFWSALGVALWGYSQATPFDHTQAFDYFAGFASVLTTAAGVYGFVKNVTAEGVTSFTKGAGVIIFALATMSSVACGGNAKPQLTPIGQTAATADKVVTTADTAITALEPITDAGLIPKSAMRKILDGTERMGHGSKSLVVALRSCTSTPANCADVTSAIAAIRAGLNDGLTQIPDGPSKDRVKAILQPVFDLLLGLFAPDVTVQRTTACLAGEEMVGFTLRGSVIDGVLCGQRAVATARLGVR